MRARKAYLKTQTNTASKEQLMIMLFRAALKHIRSGASLLEEGKKDEAMTPLDKASEIVLELMATLDHKAAPELSQQLTEIYKFVAFRLSRAIAAQDAQFAREAERAFAPIVDGFEGAVRQLGVQV